MHKNITLAFLVATSVISSEAFADTVLTLQSPAERLVDQAQSARKRSEFRLAASLLDDAENERHPPLGQIHHERGLLARDRGHLEEAATALQQATVHSPPGMVHLDHAGVLVQLGRWPEAIVVLRRAFEERGSTLVASTVAADERFIRLAGFAPYDNLLEERRLEEESPFFKLSVRLASVERSTQESQQFLDQIAIVAIIAARLATSMGAPVFLFVIIGLIFTFGIRQVGLVGPPWTLILGMVASAVTWHLTARLLENDDGGWNTIGVGALVVFGPWVIYLAIRWLLRWRKLAKIAATDPFAKDHLPHTLAVLEEVTRLGRRWMDAEGAEKDEAARDLDVAKIAIRQRFGIGQD